MKRLMLWYKHSLKYEISKREDRYLLWLARRLPAKLRMWVVVTAYVDVTTKEPYPEPDRVGYSTLMKGAFPQHG